MSSARKATTPAARRNPSRAAKAPRAVTGAPQRVRTSPHGDQSGGTQADSHEAADLSDEGSSDGDVGVALRPPPPPPRASEGGGLRAARAAAPEGTPTLPEYVEEALSRERTSANVRFRLRYVGCNDSAAVVAHQMRTRLTLIPFALFSRLHPFSQLSCF